MLSFAKANKGSGQATMVADLSTVPKLRQAAAATATILFTYGGHAMLVWVLQCTVQSSRQSHGMHLCLCRGCSTVAAAAYPSAALAWCTSIRR